MTNIKLNTLLKIVFLCITFYFSASIFAQCSTTNPAGCSCPIPGQTNCQLLPDIIAGKRTLNSTTGWTEYPQSAGAPNKGLLRIDVSTPNIGWGPVETISTNTYVCGNDTMYNFFPPPGFLCPDGSYPKRLIKQRIYNKVGNTLQFTDRDAGWMVYHPSHGHIHIEGWGLYTLRLRDVSIADTLQWPVVNSGVKTSFCLIDLTTCSGALGDCVDSLGNVLNNASFPNYGLAGGYNCGNVRQGISVGRVDIYSRSLDESFVKIPYEACNGSYHVVVQIDPDDHFLEMKETNNWLAAQIPISKQRTSNTNPYAYIFSKKGNAVCQGGSLELEASGASNYLWSNGATTQKININIPGRYWVRATTPCGIATSDTLDIVESSTSSFPAITINDTICTGDRADLYASGNAHWYDAQVNGNLIFIGNNFQTGTLFNTTNFYVADQPSVFGGNIGPVSTSFSGAGNYTASLNEYLIFNAFLPFKLKKLRVDASTAGVRRIQLRDQYGHLLQEKVVSLVAGIQDITVDLFVPSGLNHQLGLSAFSPAGSLYMSTTTNSTIGYPFKLNSIGIIVGSSLGDRSFPFFYNWEVEVTNQACNNGQRKSVTAYVIAPSVINSQPQSISVCETSDVSFAVSASGPNTVYQWQVSTDGGTNFSDIPGASSPTFSLPVVTLNLNANRYRCMITGGCVLVYSDAATLTVNPKPVFTLNNIPSNLCISDTAITLSSTLPGGIWNGNGVQGNHFNPAAAGIATVAITYTVTNSFGCTSSRSTSIQVNDCPERHLALNADKSLVIYPNPNNGQLKIKVLTDLYTKFGMDIYGSDGRYLKSQQFTGLFYGIVLPVDLSNLPSGQYLLHFYNDEKGVLIKKTTGIIIAR
jgi:Secretion system C-terminal sorting domain/Ig-like domain CHU_C associated/Lysyl oxidase